MPVTQSLAVPRSLQLTDLALSASTVGLAANIYELLGLSVDGDLVQVSQGNAQITAKAVCRNDLADNVVDVQQGSALAAQLGSQFGTVTVERA